MSRDAAIARAKDYFDSGAFREDLARRVALKTESQNPERTAVLFTEDAFCQKRPAAGSAGGISPPAAHRTVRKPLDLHGSHHPVSRPHAELPVGE